MFGNIGWGEFMILLVAALVILGPERLPGAVSWISKSLRQVREYAGGATQQLKDELGPEFDDLRKPLSELNQLRGMTPRAAITKHLLDGDDSIFTGNFDDKKPRPGTTGSASTPKPTTTPLGDGDKPPIDIDAT
ncbi:Sec-independent protein translocase protein TatB [Rhodococcus triatomae]|nr:sec-independent translocase [Rhodococcus triatomae BKS 15-14]